jgi:hypothetical protein
LDLDAAHDSEYGACLGLGKRYAALIRRELRFQYLAACFNSRTELPLG